MSILKVLRFIVDVEVVVCHDGINCLPILALVHDKEMGCARMGGRCPHPNVGRAAVASS